MRGVLADLPATASEALFHAPERESAGNGELLFLAIDPDTCTGCGLCIEACEPSALYFDQKDPARLETASRAVFRDLSGLPAPSSESRARVDASLGAPRGELLAPSARAVLQGSDGAEAGSGARLALRLALGTAAAKAVEERRPLLREIAELREGLAGAIHDTLGRALPDRDLDTLARGLDSLDRPETELAELTARVETAFDSERIDVARLRRG